MIKQYKKLILSIGLFTALGSAVTRAAASGSGTMPLATNRLANRELFQNIFGSPLEVRSLHGIAEEYPRNDSAQKIALFADLIEPFLQERPLEDIVEDIRALCLNGSIERDLVNLHFIREFFSNRLDCLKRVVLGEKDLLYRDLYPNSFRYETSSHITLKNVEVDGKYLLIARMGYNNYLVLKRNDNFVTGQAREILPNINTGDTLVLFSIDPLCHHIGGTGMITREILERIRRKLQLPNTFSDRWLNDSLTVHNIDPQNLIKGGMMD